MSDDERAGARATAIDEAISRIRERVESTGQLITLEVDAYRQITDLRLTPQAMGADVTRLAGVIMELHRLACEKAEAAADRAFADVSARFEPPERSIRAAEDEWAESAPPLRTTYSI